MNSSNLIKYTKPPKTKFNLWNCGSNGKPAKDPNYPTHGVFPGKSFYISRAVRYFDQTEFDSWATWATWATWASSWASWAS